MNFMQQARDESHQLSQTRPRQQSHLTFGAHSFSPLATRSLFLPRKEGQRSALLFLPWDSSERCKGVCKDVYRQLCIQSWTTHVWEEIREVTTGKGGKPRVLPIRFATSGHSDPPADVLAKVISCRYVSRWQAELLTMSCQKQAPCPPGGG